MFNKMEPRFTGKIIIGSDRDNLESPIAKRFGHANYYLMYNTETKNLEVF